MNYQRMQEGRGRLIVICPSCDSLLNKFSNDAVVASLAGQLEVSFTGLKNILCGKRQPTPQQLKKLGRPPRHKD